MSQRDPVDGAAAASPSSGVSAAPPQSLRATLDVALGEALALTRSTLGYLYFYDEETRQFTLHAWSPGAMEACRIADPARVYDLDRTGIWGDVVRARATVLVNDFDAPDPRKRGYPEGHARLHRFLSVPVHEGERIVAVVGVANKEAAYDEDDVRVLEELMRRVWPVARRLAADERQRKLSAIVEQSPLGIATCDGSGRIDWVNARFAAWVGVGRERLLGRDIRDLNPAQAEDPAAFWAWLRAGGTFEREVRLGGEGAPRVARVAASPVRDGAGAITHFAVVAEDVTERRELEAQLRRAQRLESIGTLAGGMAHDFNNVLTGALGLATAAREALPDHHAAAEDLDELLHVLRRGGALTRSLLTFGRAECATRRPERLAELLAGAGRLVGAGLGDGIALEIRDPDGDVVADVDRGQIEQVLVNLAANARDAMPDGGRLALAAGAVEVGEALAARHLVAPGPYAVLTVEDTGVGMDQATLARIFDPFFTTRVGKGAGLGLCVVHGIVRQHRGFVDVRSAPGRGARFDVYLPRHAPAAEEPEDPAPRGAGEAVLLAEDEPLVRSVWTSVLRRHGYDVMAVENGEQAVEAVREAPGRFQLVLMGVATPRAGGSEAAAALRRIDAGVRVLLGGGGARPGGGADATPPRRPVPAEELLRAVRRELDAPFGGGEARG